MPLRRILLLLVVVAVTIYAVTVIKRRAAERRVAEQPPPEGAFVLVSPAFGHGDMIPAEYTADGRNASPPLVWDNVPDGTQTFALIAEDPDAPARTFTHWLICEIPGSVRELKPGLPRTEQVPGLTSGVQGNNGFRHLGYGGPNPPPGKEHHYYFRLYALNTTLDMVGSYTRKQLLTAMKDHILAETALMGRYAHPEEEQEAEVPTP